MLSLRFAALPIASAG